MENNLTKTNWSPCLECTGNGRLLRGPSRKRLRMYRYALGEFEARGSIGTPPSYPTKNSAICPACTASGLVAAEHITARESSFPKLAIVGGGIGGTALAVACLHRGIPFTLYERDESFDARSQGYGLTLQQASKAIAGLGITHLDGGITSTKHVVHTPNGKIIGEWGMRKWKKELPEGSLKRKNIHIARQSLRLSLLGQLQDSTSVKWGHRFLNFSETETGDTSVDFEFKKNIITEEADLLVGADGIRSSVRTLLIDEAKAPLDYLGCMVVLGICPLAPLRKLESPLLDSATAFQTVNGHERIYLMPYDHEHIMWQLSFPFPESDAKLLNKKGQKFLKAEAIARLQWHDPIPQILASTPESKITGYPVYDRELLDPAWLNHEYATLIGDAAHPMSPFKGQGANQAILDALSLARRITSTCGPDSDWRSIGLREKLLNDFEKDMIQRTSPKVIASAKAAQVLHTKSVLHEGDEPRGRGF